MKRVPATSIQDALLSPSFRKDRVTLRLTGISVEPALYAVKSKTEEDILLKLGGQIVKEEPQKARYHILLTPDTARELARGLQEIADSMEAESSSS